MTKTSSLFSMCNIFPIHSDDVFVDREVDTYPHNLQSLQIENHSEINKIFMTTISSTPELNDILKSPLSDPTFSNTGCSNFYASSTLHGFENSNSLEFEQQSDFVQSPYINGFCKYQCDHLKLTDITNRNVTSTFIKTPEYMNFEENHNEPEAKINLIEWNALNAIKAVNSETIVSKEPKKLRIWSSKDDESLSNLIKIYGKDFEKIAQLMDNFTKEQIIKHYREVLGPRLRISNSVERKKQFWSEEDKKKLLALKAEGKTFKELCSEFSNRSPQQIRGTFYRLFGRQKMSLNVGETTKPPTSPQPIVSPKFNMGTSSNSNDNLSDNSILHKSIRLNQNHKDCTVNSDVIISIAEKSDFFNKEYRGTDPLVSWDEWDDRMLYQMIKVYGYNLEQVAKHMTWLTLDQITLRYHEILKLQSCLLKKV